MPEANNATGGTHSTRFPFRRTMLVVETLVGVSGLAGSIQLLVGVATPPVSVLNPLGLASWTLPAGWLFLTVALPSAGTVRALSQPSRTCAHSRRLPVRSGTAALEGA
jgi:hypothetical protein